MVDALCRRYGKEVALQAIPKPNWPDYSHCGRSQGRPRVGKDHQAKDYQA